MAVCSNCGASDFVWAENLKTGTIGRGILSLRSGGELSLGTRICRQCGHADLFVKDPTILRQPHTWRPGEFVPIPPRASMGTRAPAPAAAAPAAPPAPPTVAAPAPPPPPPPAVPSTVPPPPVPPPEVTVPPPIAPAESATAPPQAPGTEAGTPDPGAPSTKRPPRKRASKSKSSTS